MAAKRRSPARAVLRFIASVMVVSGVLLIANAAVTLAWQEPLSWLLAEREQATLGKALRNPPKRVIEGKPLNGDAIGTLSVPSVGIDQHIVEGTATTTLRKGPGHYARTPLPGKRGTAAVAGHRTTYGAPFRRLDDVRKGDRIVVDMPYGSFTYRAERTRIVDDSALWVLRRKQYDRLVLTACHPLYSAAQRVVVFARLVGRRPSRLKRSA